VAPGLELLARRCLFLDTDGLRLALVLLAAAPVIGHADQEKGTMSGCCARLDYRLEKTFLKVDVLQLTLVVDDATAAGVDSIIAGHERSDDVDRVVVSYFLGARSADITLAFLRSISYDQFIDGARKTSQQVAGAGLIEEEAAERIHQDTERRFAFLKETGVRRGDSLYYTLRGDSVTTRYVSADGTTMLQDLRVGPERRMSLLGSYFAPNTNFRDGLLDLIFAER
jgi:hypothetical protein